MDRLAWAAVWGATDGGSGHNRLDNGVTNLPEWEWLRGEALQKRTQWCAAVMSSRLPIFVLAGGDAPEPEQQELRPSDALTVPKGTIELATGRCLAGELVQRLRDSGCFADPILLGPQDWYQTRVDCELIAVQGRLIQTLRQLVQAATTRLDSDQPFAVTTCDILPSAHDIRELFERHYMPHSDSMFWWQMVESELQEMGASAWKPAYHLPVTAGQAPRRLYPGHVVIARAGSLRLSLLMRLLELAYQYRNRVLERRYLGITRGRLGRCWRMICMTCCTSSFPGSHSASRIEDCEAIFVIGVA